MKSVVITGASSGIGKDLATYLAGKGWLVFAGVRKPADGEKLKAIHDAIEPLILDVTQEDQVEAAAGIVAQRLGDQTLTGLVNNAGIANWGPLPLQSMDEFRAHFEVNVFGLMAATRAFLPLLGADEAREGKPGRIVNISSNGGRIAAPFLAAYSATKHAVESLTDSLRRELVLYGIDAIVVGPGAVKTPIWDKAEKTPYVDSDWGAAIGKFADTFREAGEEGLAPIKVSKCVEKALTKRKPKARYAPVPNKLTNFYVPLLLSKRTLDKVFWNRFGLERRS